MAIAALVLGILSLVLSVASFWIFIGYLSIPALLLGIVGCYLDEKSTQRHWWISDVDFSNSIFANPSNNLDS